MRFTSPILLANVYNLLFSPDEKTTLIKVAGGSGQNSDSTNFICDPVCEDDTDNSCLNEKSYTVIVKILLKDVISDLKMETTESKLTLTFKVL